MLFPINNGNDVLLQINEAGSCLSNGTITDTKLFYQSNVTKVTISWRGNESHLWQYETQGLDTVIPYRS